MSKSGATGRSRRARPQQRKRTNRSLRTRLHAQYERLASAAVSTAVIMGAVSLLYISFIGFNFHLPWHSQAEPAKATTVAVQTTPVQPKLQAAPAKASACGAFEQANQLFSACPSFVTDYSNQAQGTVNARNFNVYAGPPIANGEAQYYTGRLSNVRIQDGSLWLEAHTDAYNGYSYTSARLDTHGKQDFLYGKLVIRAMVPTGAGTWPAIWMLPSQSKYADQSPATNKQRYQNDGEIDILESIGLQPHVVYGVAHSIAYPEDGVDRTYFNTVLIKDNDRAFHDYELDWTPTSLTFSVDGSPFFTYQKRAGADWRSWPFDQPFYLVLNLALGGTWAGSDTAHYPGDGIDKSALPVALKIQSICYYTYTGKQ